MVRVSQPTVDRKDSNARNERLRVAGLAGFVTAVLMALMAAAPAAAQDAWQSPHVRPERGMQRFVDEAARRSPSIRELMERLEHLDVTVYVRARAFTQLDLEGRVALLSTGASRRTLVIELACGRSELTQMATLGHELFHAVEIAEEPSVVNAATLAALYGRIGMLTGETDGRRTFESLGAAAAGQQVRRELRTGNTRNSNGT